MQARITELECLIRYHKEKYTNGEPEISDKEFDDFVDELKNLDVNNPVLLEVGATPTYGKIVPHAIPMCSLDKISFQRDVRGDIVGDGMLYVNDWYDKHQQEKVWSYKVDGIAGEICFKCGKLVEASNRGDGDNGFELTDMARVITTVPTILNDRIIEPFDGLKINVNSCFIRIRGEFYIPKSYFSKYLAGIAANARNSTSGAMMGSDPKRVIDCSVQFLAYKVFIDDEEPVTMTRAEEIVNSLTGFHGIQDAKFQFNKLHKGVLSRFDLDALDEERKKLDFDTDGLVFVVDNTEERDSYGFRGKLPMGAVAYKFPADKAETTLTNIVWNPGRLEKFAPVGVFNTVRLAGTSVCQASLYNLAELKRLDIAIGDTILVEKAGDIIPRIVRVVSRVPRKGNPVEDINYPATCPSCGQATEENGIFIFCKNPSCGVKAFGDLVCWCEALALEPIKPCHLQRLYEDGIVKTPVDLYFLNEADLSRVGRCSSVIAQKIIEKILSRTELTIPEFLAGLGINGLGSTYHQRIAEKFKTLKAIREFKFVEPKDTIPLAAAYDENATAEQPVTIQGVGNALFKKLYDGMQSKKELIDKLLTVVTVKDFEDPAPKTGIFAGKSFCVTGTLSRKRKLVEDEITALGGNVSGSVGKSLNYLIVGEEPGSKVDAAKKKGVKILTEDEYNSMVKNSSSQVAVEPVATPTISGSQPDLGI